MIKKTDKVRALVQAGNYQAALRIASKFRLLTREDKKALVMAHECHHSPDFYAQLGLNPDKLKQHGVEILKRLWGNQAA